MPEVRCLRFEVALQAEEADFDLTAMTQGRYGNVLLPSRLCAFAVKLL
jgi:hypothetical protein